MSNKELWEKLTELLGGEETARRFRVWAAGVIKKELLKRSESEPDEFFLHQAGEILADLNKRAGRRFSLTPEASKMIKGILASGYLLEDFIRVHEVKCAQWLGNERMEPNIRPSTLYRPRHFDEYLAEWWAMDRKRSELEEKRRAAIASQTSSEQRTVNSEQKEKQAALIAKLMAKEWWQFASFREFMIWTVSAPTLEALENYPMPERIRQMRRAPGMLLHVSKNEVPEWAEREYQEIVQGYLTTEDTEKSREKQRSSQGVKGKGEGKSDAEVI